MLRGIAMHMLQDTPEDAGGSVAAQFLLTLTGIVAASVLAARILAASGYLPEHPIAYAMAVILPVALVGPAALYLLLQQRRFDAAADNLDTLVATDSLTCTLSPHAFAMRIKARLAEAPAIASADKGALLIVDIDDFSLINANFGHEMGNAALRQVADILSRAIGARDYVGRLGGDTFAVFLTEAGQQRAEKIARQIGTNIAGTTVLHAGVACPVTVSIGGSTNPGGMSSLELHNLAHQRVALAKREGGNRALFEDPAPMLRRPEIAVHLPGRQANAA